MKKAFSMLEIIFVIIILGILTTIALPKFAMTTNDAHIVKAKSTINNIRSAIIIIKSEGIFIGTNTFPNKLDNLQALISNDNDKLFDTNGSKIILQNPILSSTNNGGWSKIDNNIYRFTLDNQNTDFIYNPLSGEFICDISNNLCLKLTK